MKFWWFMLCCTLLIPLLMIVAGRLMEKRAPKRINGFVGYRTVRSMKNVDTWSFAQTYCGKLWWMTGCALLLPVLGAQLALFGKSEEAVAVRGVVSMFLSMFALLVPIFFTEKALKKNFTEDGYQK